MIRGSLSTLKTFSTRHSAQAGIDSEKMKLRPFDPFDQMPEALRPSYAANYLEVSKSTLYSLRRRGLLDCFQIPSKNPGRGYWRFPVRGLDAFMQKYRLYRRAWLFHLKEEMPGELAALILGITLEGVYQARHRGQLKDFRPASIKTYLRRKLRREAFSELKAEIKTLKRQIRKLEASTSTQASSLTH